MSFYSLIAGGTVNTGTLWTDVLFALCTVVLLGQFGRSPSLLALRALEVPVLFLTLCSIDVVCNLFGVSAYPGPTFAAQLAVLVLYALFQTRLTVVDRAARIGTFMALFVLTVSVTRTIAPASGNNLKLLVGVTVPSAFSYISMVVATVYLRRFSIERFDYVPRQFLILIVAVDLLGLFAGQVFLSLHDAYDFLDKPPTSGSLLVNVSKSVSMVNLMVCSSLILVAAIAYLMFYLMAREHDERTELLVTKRNEEDNAQMALATKSMYESMREMRHEIKNHDAYLLALLESKEYEKVADFVRGYTRAHANVTHYVSSGNPLVDAVVNAKVAVGRTRGIEIKSMLAVPPELPFDEDDVFCLLANLLDNAIDGASAAGLDREATVQLKIMPEAGYFFVSVVNPCDPAAVRHNDAGELVTTKADGSVHGYGTKVIKRIAQKYQGTASFVVKEDDFIASVMLAGEADPQGNEAR